MRSEGSFETRQAAATTLWNGWCVLSSRRSIHLSDSNFFFLITKKYADLLHQQSYRIAEEYFYLGAEKPSIRVWRRGDDEELGFGEEILGLCEIKLLLVAALMMEVDLEAMLVAFISPSSSCKIFGKPSSLTRDTICRFDNRFY